MQATTIILTKMDNQTECIKDPLTLSESDNRINVILHMPSKCDSGILRICLNKDNIPKSFAEYQLIDNKVVFHNDEVNVTQYNKNTVGVKVLPQYISEFKKSNNYVSGPIIELYDSDTKQYKRLYTGGKLYMHCIDVPTMVKICPLLNAIKKNVFSGKFKFAADLVPEPKRKPNESKHAFLLRQRTYLLQTKI